MMETMMLARATTMIAKMMVLANNVNRQNQGKYSLFFLMGLNYFPMLFKS
jgi:hypothetical protein